MECDGQQEEFSGLAELLKCASGKRCDVCEALLLRPHLHRDSPGSLLAAAASARHDLFNDLRTILPTRGRPRHPPSVVAGEA